MPIGDAIHDATRQRCPNIWATMYNHSLQQADLAAGQQPSVTAGFRWAPLMWPRLWARVAMDKPNARATLTSWSGLSLLVCSNCSCNAEEDEEGHTHQLGQNGPPERLALQLLHDWQLWHADVLVWGFLRALSMFLCQKRVFIGQVLLMKPGGGFKLRGQKEWVRERRRGRQNWWEILSFSSPCQFYKSTSQRRA